MRALTTISDLLDHKGRTVHTIEPGASLVHCAGAMLRHHVNSLLVLDKSGKLEGIITSRDLLHAAAEGGRHYDSLHVRDLMTQDLRTTDESAVIEDVEQMMIEQRIRHLPVLKGDQVTGMVSRIDVLRHYLDKQHWLSAELERYITGPYTA